MISPNERGSPTKNVPHNFSQRTNNLNNPKKVEFLEPEVKETKIWELKNAGIALGAALGFIFLQFLLMTIFDLGIVGSWILAFILLTTYSIGIYFLLEPKIVKETKERVVETVEKPVIKEVFKTVEIEKPVIRTVEKEVIKRVETPVQRIIIKSPTKHKSSPRYNYLGSELTKIYHKNSCRLGKSIKRKYKITSNNEEFFKRRNYKPCDVCIRKIKKV